MLFQYVSKEHFFVYWFKKIKTWQIWERYLCFELVIQADEWTAFFNPGQNIQQKEKKSSKSW